MDFLHELKVKRFDAVAGGGDEEEASVDLMMMMVMVMINDDDDEEASVDHCVREAASLDLR